MNEYHRGASLTVIIHNRRDDHNWEASVRPMQGGTKVNEPTTRVIIQLDACGSLLESGSHKVDNGDAPSREEGQSGML